MSDKLTTITDNGTVVVGSTHLAGRNKSIVRAIWVMLVVLLVGTFIAGIPAAYRTASHISPDTLAALQAAHLPANFPPIYLVVVDVLTMVGFVAVGVLLFWRRSDDWMPLFVGLMLIFTAGIYTNPTAFMPAPLVAPLFAIGEACQISFFYLFPDGKWLPSWVRWLVLPVAIWRLVVWAFIYLPVAQTIPQSAETYGSTPQSSLDIGLVVLFIVLGVVSQVYRYRRLPTIKQKQQVKWLLVGAMTTFSIVVLYVFVVNIFHLTATEGGAAFFTTAIARTIRQIALLALPASLCVAILRYRLLDIDVVLNRGLVIGIFTALYIVLVVVAQFVITAILGTQQSGLAIALSTAVVAVAFQPVRNRIQNFVDKRFYSISYQSTQPNADAATTETPTEAIASVIVARKIGAYEILEQIGKGGMGEVYKGRQPALERIVAIKLLTETRAQDDAFRSRFEREAKIVALLRHPNIVSMYDFGSVDDIYYMVMEFIDGEGLDRYLKKRGKLPLDEALPFINDIASALDHAHEQGLVHRDIKTANVMLQKASTASHEARLYRAILMDFGIAKFVDANTHLTQTGVIGTLDYMAPEQIAASSEVDKHADIYAFGIMIYQMLTGELPFQGNNPGQIVLAHLQQPAPDPRKIVTDLPENSAYAIMRALEKKPENRFDSAGAFALALAPYAPDDAVQWARS